MKLKLVEISHFDLLEQLKLYVSDIELMLNNQEFDLADFTTVINQKISQVEKYISKYIKPNPTEILNLLENEYSSIYDKFYTYYEIKDLKIKKEVEKLDRFRKSLKTVIAFVSITDSLIDYNNEVNIFNITQKTEFVLNKLRILFGDESYSIAHILKLNNINFRDAESIEIAVDLYKRGYVVSDSPYGNSDEVKISIKGATYIERKNKQKNSTDSDKLDKKIDSILEHLVKLGYGQEIILMRLMNLKDCRINYQKKLGRNF